MAMVPNGAMGTRQHHHVANTMVRHCSSAGFTLVEVVVSTGILGFALASSLSGLTRSLELLRSATARQQGLNAVTLDLQRQQGLVIRALAEVGDEPPWLCSNETSLARLQEDLKQQAADLPDGVTRDWDAAGESLLLVRYTSSFPAFRRQRVLAARGSAAICKDDDAHDDDANDDAHDAAANEDNPDG